MSVEIIRGNYKGQRGTAAKVTDHKIKVKLTESGLQVDIMQSSVKPLENGRPEGGDALQPPSAAPELPASSQPSEGACGAAQPAEEIVEGSAVRMTTGNYKGRQGTVIKVMPLKYRVRLDAGPGEQQVDVMKSSAKLAESGAGTASMQSSSSTAPGAGYATSRRENSSFAVGDVVDITSGTYKNEQGTVLSVTEKQLKLRLASGKEPYVNQTSVLAAPEFRSFHLLSGIATAPNPQEEVEGQLPLKKIVLQGAHERPEDYFVKRFFKDRVLICEAPLPSSKEMGLGQGPAYQKDGQDYRLVSAKVVDDGLEFWGGKKEAVRLMFVALGERSLEEELDDLADFAGIAKARKLAARLELLQSPGKVFTTTADHFEDIAEPQPSKESGGCGFIPRKLLQELVIGCAKPAKITSIQVRVYGPRLGVLKGVLTLKEGIDKIQLPPSMRKVDPSKTNHSESAWVVVTRTFPSSTSQQLERWLQGGEANKTLMEKQKPRMSPMVRRVLTSLNVADNDLTSHEKSRPRKEAFLVGVADPTDYIPEGQVVIPGLNREQLPDVDGIHCVFVSRCPCIQPEDGKRLPVLLDRPEAMPPSAWDGVDGIFSRPFGDIIFSNKGQALPETIAAGDLDGDKYFVCWTESIVKSVCPQEDLEPAVSAGQPPPKPPKGLGTGWLDQAQAHMLSAETLHEGHQIGRYYRAAEKIADESELGIRHPDAKALFRAYAQAIDQGKHGGDIVLPDHLRAKLRL